MNDTLHELRQFEDICRALKQNTADSQNKGGWVFSFTSKIRESDRSFIKTTYKEVLNLHRLACAQGELKKKDKDTYLPGKFLSKHMKWFSAGVPTKFFINRIICNTFAVIARNQYLDPVTFDKLTLCVGTLKELTKAVFGTSDLYLIADKMVDKTICSQQHRNSPSFIENVAHRIYSDCVINLKPSMFFSPDELLKSKVLHILIPELHKMQHDAMKAIYFAVLKNRSLLTPDHVRKINQCLRSRDKKLNQMARNVLRLNK